VVKNSTEGLPVEIPQGALMNVKRQKRAQDFISWLLGSYWWLLIVIFCKK